MYTYRVVYFHARIIAVYLFQLTCIVTNSCSSMLQVYSRDDRKRLHPQDSRLAYYTYWELWRVWQMNKKLITFETDDVTI